MHCCSYFPLFLTLPPTHFPASLSITFINPSLFLVSLSLFLPMSILTHAHIHEHILTSSQPRATCGCVVVSASYEGGKPRYLKCASKDANILCLLNISAISGILNTVYTFRCHRLGARRGGRSNNLYTILKTYTKDQSIFRCDRLGARRGGSENWKGINKNYTKPTTHPPAVM